MFDRRLLWLIAAGLLWAGAAGAQQPRRETQIPLDQERSVLEIGPDLRRQLGLFLEQPDFQVARLFRGDDGTLVLEISRVEGGRLVRERRALTEAELAAFRSDLAARFVARGQTRALDRSGRSGLVLTETLMGVALYGWSVPRGFDIHSSRGSVAAYLLTAGLSFYLPYRITRNVSVSVVERNAALWGSTRGAVHGIFLGQALSGTEEYFRSSNDADRRDRRVALSMIGTSIAETVIAYQLAQRPGLTEGLVAFYGAGGDFGIPFGLGLSYLAGLFDEDVESCSFDYCTTDDFAGTSAGYGAALAISLASPFIARATKQGDHYTVGDARSLRSFGLLGAQLALVPAWAAFEKESEENEKPIIASMIAGSALGLWAGNRVLRDRSLAGGDGLLVIAGHVAGGLGALGVTYLLDGGGRADDLVYISTSALGSAAGSLLTLQAVSGGSSRASGSRQAGLDVEVTPITGLLPVLARGNVNGAPMRAPLVTIRF